jgi:hypothetical protein
MIRNPGKFIVMTTEYVLDFHSRQEEEVSSFRWHPDRLCSPLILLSNMELFELGWAARAWRWVKRLCRGIKLWPSSGNYIVTWLHCPLLGKSWVNTSAATDSHATMEELFEVLFSMRLDPRLHSEHDLGMKTYCFSHRLSPHWMDGISPSSVM